MLSFTKKILGRMLVIKSARGVVIYLIVSHPVLLLVKLLIPALILR